MLARCVRKWTHPGNPFFRYWALQVAMLLLALLLGGAWRKAHYPQITDWAPYNKATNPPPA